VSKSLLLIVASFVATVHFTTAAVAQPAPTHAPVTFGSPSLSPSQIEAPPEARPMRVTGEPLSETTALTLSLGSTLAAWTVLFVAHDNETAATIGLVGTFVGPSAGHWYGGSVLTRGMGLRALGAAGLVLGFVRALQCEDNCTTDAAAAVLITGGMIAYAGGTLDDIVMAPVRVRKHNRALEELALAPMASHHGGGIALAGRF
jgi:hypothetical protein